MSWIVESCLGPLVSHEGLDPGDYFLLAPGGNTLGRILVCLDDTHFVGICSTVHSTHPVYLDHPSTFNRSRSTPRFQRVQIAWRD